MVAKKMKVGKWEILQLKSKYSGSPRISQNQNIRMSVPSSSALWRGAPHTSTACSGSTPTSSHLLLTAAEIILCSQ